MATVSTSIRVAVMQAEPSPDIANNVERLTAGVANAADQGADVIITPEMFLSGYDIGPAAARAAAEPIDGPLIEQVRSMAESAGIAIVTGWPELEDEAVYNSVVMVSAAGDVLTSYRKSHLYGDLDRSQFSAGDRLGDVVDLAGVPVALAICFDIEFPEVTRSLAQRGAHAVLVPTANWLPTVNTRMVPTRGEENGIYVVYTNYCGAEGERAYCGQSCIVDPSGNDVVRFAPGDGEGLAIDELSAGAVTEARASCDYFSNLRPEVYGDRPS